mmetsp:Transcript_35817/g.93768  ORF Transcript_35817/g.93768 Transcript_35817/m.93768 type:complete len:287 (+) Transcript_35817:8-868(+)
MVKLDVRTKTGGPPPIPAAPAMARCDWCGVRFTPDVSRPTRQGPKGRACPVCYRTDIKTLLSKRANPPAPADPDRPREREQSAPVGAGSRDPSPMVPHRQSVSPGEHPMQVSSCTAQSPETSRMTPASWDMAVKLFGTPVQEQQDKDMVESNQLPEMPSFLRAGSALTTIPDLRPDDQPTEINLQHHHERHEHHAHHQAAHSSCSGVDLFSDCTGASRNQDHAKAQTSESKPGVVHAKPVQRQRHHGACSGVDLFSDCGGEEVSAPEQAETPVNLSRPRRHMIASV